MFRPGVEQIQFHDGTIWLMSDIIAALPTATPGDDILLEWTTQYLKMAMFGRSYPIAIRSGSLEFLMAGLGMISLQAERVPISTYLVVDMATMSYLKRAQCH